jgi:hypothetical protein
MGEMRLKVVIEYSQKHAVKQELHAGHGPWPMVFFNEGIRGLPGEEVPRCLRLQSDFRSEYEIPNLKL